MRFPQIFYGITAWGILLITGCARLPAPGPTSPPQFKGNRDLAGWDIQGKVAITTATDSTNASFTWWQCHDRYRLRLFGPLGSNGVLLEGQPRKVQLTNRNGQRFQATSPEALLQQTTGWSLPVSALAYWVRGLPAPFPAANTWKLHYLDSQQLYDKVLPQTFVIDRSDLHAKIRIREWQILACK